MMLWLNYVLAGLGTMGSAILTLGGVLALAGGTLLGVFWLGLALSEYLKTRPRITLAIKVVTIVVLVTVLAAAVGVKTEGRIVMPQEILK